MARSQAGALECKAGLSLNVPRRKRVIRGPLPREEAPAGDLKADIAATYTFKVEGVSPAEKRSYKKSRTVPTWQSTGLKARSLHHVENNFHLK